MVWRRSVVRTSLITSAVGTLLVSFVPLENLSFDLATLLKPATTITNAVVVYVNQDTLALGADQGRLNRTNYARLVDHLADSGAKLVFLDVAFEQPSATPEVDQTLARAIRKQGSVILVAGAEDQDEPGSRHVTRLFPPIRTFAEAAKGWGHAEVFGNIVRQISGQFAFTTYAGWAAATNLAPQLQREAENRERWLNYYGSPENTTIPTCSLQNAVSDNVPSGAGFFANKIVFVGQNFLYGDIGGRKDTFGTPYSRFGFAPSPGVVIHATALLNLISGDWIREMTLPWQWLSAVAWGGGGKRCALFALTETGIGLSRGSRFGGAGAVCGFALCPVASPLVLVMARSRMRPNAPGAHARNAKSKARPLPRVHQLPTKGRR